MLTLKRQSAVRRRMATPAHTERRFDMGRRLVRSPAIRDDSIRAAVDAVPTTYQAEQRRNNATAQPWNSRPAGLKTSEVVAQLARICRRLLIISML
jgi:hypothetical protein